MGMPPGKPMPWAMRSITDVSGCDVEKVTRRPIPADSQPSGTGGGEGMIVLRVWGTGDEEVDTEDGDAGYIGRE